jgi:hypothetical protein
LTAGNLPNPDHQLHSIPTRKHLQNNHTIKSPVTILPVINCLNFHLKAKRIHLSRKMIQEGHDGPEIAHMNIETENRKLNNPPPGRANFGPRAFI